MNAMLLINITLLALAFVMFNWVRKYVRSHAIPGATGAPGPKGEAACAPGEDIAYYKTSLENFKANFQTLENKYVNAAENFERSLTSLEEKYLVTNRTLSERAVALSQLGLSEGEIAALENCRMDEVRKALKDKTPHVVSTVSPMGISDPVWGSKVVKLTANQDSVLRQYAEGKSMIAIAKANKTSVGAVLSTVAYLRRKGIPLPYRHRPSNNSK